MYEFIVGLMVGLFGGLYFGNQKVRLSVNKFLDNITKSKKKETKEPVVEKKVSEGL